MGNPENALIIPDEVIMSKIYFIRELRVMIDNDLAELIDVKAIRLREQVKRNIEKFPVHFMFRLTSEEVEIKVSHFAIPSRHHLGSLYILGLRISSIQRGFP